MKGKEREKGNGERTIVYVYQGHFFDKNDFGQSDERSEPLSAEWNNSPEVFLGKFSALHWNTHPCEEVHEFSRFLNRQTPDFLVFPGTSTVLGVVTRGKSILRAFYGGIVPLF